MKYLQKFSAHACIKSEVVTMETTPAWWLLSAAALQQVQYGFCIVKKVFRKSSVACLTVHV